MTLLVYLSDALAHVSQLFECVDQVCLSTATKSEDSHFFPHHEELVDVAMQ